MTKKEIQDTLLHGERLTLECKLAENSLPKSVWETYSAFANTLGGIILLGVEEHKGEEDPAKRFAIQGVSNARKMVEDFWNTINSSKVNENILLDKDVQVVDIDGKDVVCINVPQADWSMKPIYLNENVYKGAYKRNHEGDYHCKEREVRMMIRDSNEEGNDGALMEGFNMDDIDMDSLHRYRNLFRMENEGHPWNDVDDKTFLIYMKGYAFDRATNREGLTAAGLMMFGKGLSVSERFANFRMDYLDMSGLMGDERWKDRLTYDGRWENNFYKFFTIVLPKLTFDMPRPFRMPDGIQRIDDTPQIAAVREAFTNAIIHCDFFGAAGILRIEKHDDRLVLRNPGTLLIPIKDVYNGGQSKARNPRIQTMLRMIGFGENVGSGFPKILKAWEEVDWKKPILENKLELEETSLTLFVQNEGNTKNILKDDKKNDKKDDKKELSERQRLIIDIISIEPDITIPKMTRRIGVSQSTISREISKLKELGINVKHVGGRTYGHWEIIKEGLC